MAARIRPLAVQASVAADPVTSLPPPITPSGSTTPATSATMAQPPTSGWSAVAAPHESQALANLPRTTSPTPHSTSAHANTFASQPPITHSPAAGVCRTASENRAALSTRPTPVGSMPRDRCHHPAASASQPNQRPIHAASASGRAAATGPSNL